VQRSEFVSQRNAPEYKRGPCTAPGKQSDHQRFRRCGGSAIVIDMQLVFEIQNPHLRLWSAMIRRLIVATRILKASISYLLLSQDSGSLTSVISFSCLQQIRRYWRGAKIQLTAGICTSVPSLGEETLFIGYCRSQQNWQSLTHEV
jgi:hypothetical protein